ncbi:MAG TPA: hypothetical protein VF587_09255 [Solirubrobacteraceae bacterium]|jgi:hypothetical protein
MDADHTSEPRSRMRLVAVIGAAALAVPGGLAIGNAFAADSGSGSAAGTSLPVQQEEQQQPDDGDRPDCPKKDGAGAGDNGSGSGATAPETSGTSDTTPL